LISPTLWNALISLFLSNVMLIVTSIFLCAGILACLDGYMNIAMEQTEEYVNGQLKNKYGDAFIRGNNGTNLKCISIVISCLSGRIAR